MIGFPGVNTVHATPFTFGAYGALAASRTRTHIDLSKKLDADNTIVYEESDEQFLKNLTDEEGLLDSAIVFAPSDRVINAAIRSVKKGGIIVLGASGNVANFPPFEEKIVKGSVIGTRRDMADLIKMQVTQAYKSS
jgi:propanol-preferring alcohol dehydrogenase